MSYRDPNFRGYFRRGAAEPEMSSPLRALLRDLRPAAPELKVMVDLDQINIIRDQRKVRVA